jgi:hypothetical protein
VFGSIEARRCWDSRPRRNAALKTSAEQETPVNIEQFRATIKTRPFKPFTISTSSGDGYPVSHPEAVWQSPGGHTAIVAVRDEVVVMIDVDEVTELVCSKRKTPKKPK